VLIDETEPEKLLDLHTIYPLWPVPVKGVYRLDDGEAGLANSTLASPILALVILAVDELFEIFRMCPMIGGGVSSKVLKMPADEGEIQRRELVGD
jgi:hypothetical protein